MENVIHKESQITKVFEQCLDHGVSLDLYYCVRAIQWAGGLVTMTALADRLQFWLYAVTPDK